MSVPAPRSTLWKGVLGAAPIAATAITLELGRSLVVDSFGDAEMIEALAEALRVFSVLVIAGGLLIAARRWYSARREGEWLVRTRELLAGLEVEEVGLPAAAAPPVGPVRADCSALPILRALPLREHDSTAVLAVLAAVVAAEQQESPPPPARTATALLNRLRGDMVLYETTSQRYRMSESLDAHAADSVYESLAWATALGALLHHYAAEATAWAAGLGHVGYAKAARRWFTVNARAVHDLITFCVELPPNQLPAAVFPDLVRILDAMEVWLSTSGTDTSEFAGLCDRASKLPKRKVAPLHRALLAVRAEPRIPVHGRYRPRAWSTGVAARSRHDSALSWFRTGDLTAEKTATRLEQVLWMLPRTDIQAEVCVLINLAVMELIRGRLDAAADHLDVALTRTEKGRDPGGRVHAQEIKGIQCWMSGDRAAAARHWRTALTGYGALADPIGASRCRRHLLTATEEIGPAIEDDHLHLP